MKLLKLSALILSSWTLLGFQDPEPDTKGVSTNEILQKPIAKELILSKLKTRVLIRHFQIPGQPSQEYVAPAFCKFYVTDYDPQNEIYFVYFTEIKGNDSGKYRAARSALQSFQSVMRDAGVGEVKEVELYTTYQISADHFILGRDFDPMNALIHGTLAVPFKYRPNSGEVSGDGTIGYYGGFAYHFRRWSIAPIGSAGVSTVKNVKEGTESDDFALTLSVGALVTFRDSFQLGLVTGLDRVSDPDWQHNGKVWVSFMVGYQFGK